MKSITEKYDLVVAGGGLAGFSAAIAAARHGASVALVQDRPVLGGNSSSEVRVTPHGAAAFHGYARESGIISEVLVEDRAKNHAVIRENGWTNSVWDMILYDLAQRTENLTLHLNTPVLGAEVEDGRIVAALAKVLNAEVDLRLEARMFVDCTGDGTLGALAGAEWLRGEEASDDYNEPMAPKERGDGSMGSSLHFKTVDVGRPVDFQAPEWAVRYDDSKFFTEGGRLIPTLESGYWWIEIGTPWDTLHENEEIRHELTRHVLGIWDYLKNRDPFWSPRATNLALDWVGQVPGKRESRRLLGEYVMTENDLRRSDSFDDEVAFGGWYVDLHTIGGLLKEVGEPVTAARLKDPGTAKGAAEYVGPFGVPMRSLVSRDLSNLFFAGRNISTTRVALGSTRVMGTAAAMGQAVGTAAALIDAPKPDLRAEVPQRIAEVQQVLLRDGCFLPSVSNEDADDLARSARVSASSEEHVTGVGPNTPNRLGGIDHWRGYPVYPFTGELKNRTAQWIAHGGDRELRRISLALKNSSDAPLDVQATLHRVEHIWDYRTDPGAPVATTTLTVPPGGPNWVSWEVDLEAGALGDAPGYVRVDLAAAERVEWVVSPHVLPGQIAAYEDSPGRYRRFGGGQTLSFTVEPPQTPYGPENVIAGATRPHRAANQWRSDPASPLPQWIELAWTEPQAVSQVQLTFAGNLLREYHAYPPLYRDPQCVRAYDVQAFVDGRWLTVASQTHNYSNRVVHDFKTVKSDRLRVVVHATNGDSAAGIYEIRCYEGRRCTPTYQS
ncbi:FAD-dependent oxidoreductase [Leucobacter sp. gxy201]|uniref:FAD-dependent oxidoreductase n=1 Tax=Leucobacter sp. gxy201 TaxID=2957200 RepID=UPI003DA0F819